MSVSNTNEKRRPLLFLSGMVIAFSFTLVAFEWRTPYHGTVILERAGTTVDIESENPPITVRKEKVKKVVDLSSPSKVDAKPLEIPIDPDKLKDDLEPVDLPDGFPDMDQEDEPDGNYEIDTETVRKPWELDDQPHYIRGDEHLMADLTKLANPPLYCYEMDAGAVVSVRFVVDANGKITDPSIAKSTSRCFEQAAIDAIMKLEGFTPGKRAGNAVPVELYQTFRFELK